MIPFQNVKTKRLELRPLRVSDFKAWQRANDHRLEKQSAFDQGRQPSEKMTRAAFSKRVKSERDLWKRDRMYAFGVFHRGDYVGTVSLMIQSRVVLQTAGVGCNICNNRWREGFASEAVEGLIRFAFRKAKIHRVIAEIRTENRPSAAAVKKLGFRKESVAKRLLYEHGGWHDMFIFALTAEERGVKGLKPTIRAALSES